MNQSGKASLSFVLIFGFLAFASFITKPQAQVNSVIHQDLVAVLTVVAGQNFPATATPTSTAIVGIIPVRTFTSAQSTTPTPIATTAGASSFTHVKIFVQNTGTAGDFITVYQGANAGIPIYAAPGGGTVSKDIWATAVNGPVSIGGGNVSGSVMQTWGYFDQQTYQFPVNLPTQ